MSAPSGQCRLDGRDSTLIFCWNQGPPALLYQGAKLTDNLDLETFALTRIRPLPQAVLDVVDPVSLHPEGGRGFLGYPGLVGRRDLADWDGQQKLQSIEPIDHGVLFHLHDEPRKLALTLRCTLDPETDVAVFTSQLKNSGDTDFDLDWLCAAAIAPDAAYSEALSFHGRWCAEFEVSRDHIMPGLTMKENRRGRTSHDAFPGLILTPPSTDQNQGACIGLHLGWSGNHRMVLEKLSSGDLQVQMGVLFLGGEGQLKPGAQFETPPLYVAFADNGLNALSQKFHDHVRKRIVSFPTPDKPRPVIVNTWEAIYFNHNWDSLTALVDAAAAAGAERFVLDDGWFEGRPDDTSGLGDWFADPDKYPNGLKPLSDYVHDKGLEFGLWVEPEMANPNSQLLTKHPDWALSLAPYPVVEGRNQLVLDLSNNDVIDYLFERLSALVSENNVAYLKWDMNRDLVMPGNTHNTAGAYQQTRALYVLIDRLCEQFPALEIESCASGGGRVDYGILERTHRFWPSDSNDPVERVAIQTGFSYFFPPEVMGAHIGPEWAHTSGRGLDVLFRALVASPGHMGIEADLRKMGDDDRAIIKAEVARHKADRKIWHTGTFFRIETPDPALTGFASISKNKDQARVVLVQTARPASALAAPLKICRLDPDKIYKVVLSAATGPIEKANRKFDNPLWGQGVVLPGSVLMQAGLVLPALYAQTALALSFEAVVP